MSNDPVTIVEETTRAIEKWFSETHKNEGKFREHVKLLILHPLHQLEERLKRIEHQTKTHWAN